MAQAAPAGTPARPHGAGDAGAQPKLQRRRSGRIVAGVSGGLADHLDVRVLWVRLALAVLGALSGAGILAYALLWLLVPQEPAGTPEHPQTAKERQQAFAIVALGIAIAIGFSSLSGLLSPWVALPIGATLAGIAVVWREADTAQRRRAGSGSLLSGMGSAGAARVLGGIGLVVVGLGAFLLQGLDLNQVQFALVAVVAALVGFAVLTVPWWLRLVRDLGEERRVRIRTQERAEIAAHLHDSVLQTLALIQKQPEAPREVQRLARGQERQLRNWLYGVNGYSGGTGGAEAPRTLAKAIAVVAGEVEDTFAIKVDQVVVGDAELDAPLDGLVRACREAAVNAAKHAGVDEVSVYAEVEPEQVEVFVRDRGKGFDERAVGNDRHGLADSIRGRVTRNGGTVRLRTAPGEGTEVALRMPRTSEGART